MENPGIIFHVLVEMATSECTQLLANAETYVNVAKAQEEANAATFARLKVCSGKVSWRHPLPKVPSSSLSTTRKYEI